MSSRFISLYLPRDLEDSGKTKYLKREKSLYRPVAPDKNLVTKEDCEKVASFKDYLDRYEDQSLGCSIADAKRGGVCC